MKTEKEYNHPQYINTPYFIFQDEKLDFFNKYLFAFFWGLAVCGKTVKVSNPYLATFFKVDESYIGKRIKELEEMGYIKRTIVKYKRVIEVTRLVYQGIEVDDRANLELVPPTGGPSANIELPPPTGGGGSSHRRTLPPPTGGPNNIDNIKDYIKIPSISPVGGRKEMISLSQMLEDNPYNIPEQMLSDWLEVRRAKKAKMTQTAWSGTNSVLKKLVDSGLDAIECFESMVVSGWQGMKVSYFQKEIDALKPKTQLKYVPKEDRAAEYQRIAAREREAEQRKNQEKKDAIGFKAIVDQSRRRSRKEIEAQHEAKRLEMGLSVKEYSAYVLEQAKYADHG